MTVFTTTAFKFFDDFKDILGEKAVNFATDTFKCLLTTSTFVPNAATHSVLADITNELSGNGYARQTLGSVTWTKTGGLNRFDFADIVFTASGGSLVLRNAIIYDDTVASPLVDPLVGWFVVDDTPADVTVTDTNTLTLPTGASGGFELDG